MLVQASLPEYELDTADDMLVKIEDVTNDEKISKKGVKKTKHIKTKGLEKTFNKTVRKETNEGDENENSMHPLESEITDDHEGENIKTIEIISESKGKDDRVMPPTPAKKKIAKKKPTEKGSDECKDKEKTTASHEDSTVVKNGIANDCIDQLEIDDYQNLKDTKARESDASTNSEISITSFSTTSDEERVAVKKDQVVGETQKIKKLKKKRARRNTEKLASDEIDDLSETDDAIEKHTHGHLSVQKREALLVIDPTKPDFKNEKVSITTEEQISPKKPNDTVQVEEGTFAKPKLKKAERIKRALPKEELEVVDLKKHKLEQLALHEMVKMYIEIIHKGIR